MNSEPPKGPENPGDPAVELKTTPPPAITADSHHALAEAATAPNKSELSPFEQLMQLESWRQERQSGALLNVRYQFCRKASTNQPEYPEETLLYTFIKDRINGEEVAVPVECNRLVAKSIEVLTNRLTVTPKINDVNPERLVEELNSVDLDQHLGICLNEIESSLYRRRKQLLLRYANVRDLGPDEKLHFASICSFIWSVRLKLVELVCRLDNQDAQALDKERGDSRTPFEKDRDAVLSSGYLKRLQHVTQVENYLFSEGDRAFEVQHYHTRLTHTISVQAIALDIVRKFFPPLPKRSKTHRVGPQNSGSRYFDVDELVLRACCLAHDLGHPPFGHVAEKLIHFIMRQHGGFEANAQTIRIVRILEPSQRGPGMNLTRHSMLSMLKYPWVFKRNLGMKKFSIYPGFTDLQPNSLTPVKGDERAFEWMMSAPIDQMPTDLLRTLECDIMDCADDIAYTTSDFCEAISNNDKLWSLTKMEGFRAFVNDYAEDLSKDFAKLELNVKIDLKKDSEKFKEWFSKKSANYVMTENLVEFLWRALAHPQARPTQSTDFDKERLRTRKEIEQNLLSFFLQEKYICPSGDGGIYCSTDAAPKHKNIEYDTARTYYKISDKIKVSTRLYRHPVHLAMLVILKHAVKKFIHYEGEQARVHRLGGLMTSLVLAQVLESLKGGSREDLKYLEKRAREIFLDEHVKDMFRAADVIKLGDVDDENLVKVLMRFGCDLVVSLRENQIPFFFEKLCLIRGTVATLRNAPLQELRNFLHDDEMRRELGSESRFSEDLVEMWTYDLVEFAARFTGSRPRF